MKFVAKLVTVSLMTRVIVPEDMPEAEIINKARAGFIEKLHTDLHDNVEEVYDDDEMPFGEDLTDEETAKMYETFQNKLP